MHDTMILIAVVAVITFILRAIPFAVFGGKKEMPETVRQVAELLPAAIIAVLVIYCIKSDLVLPGMGTIATMTAVLVVVILHLWKRNILLSIFGGTVVYMGLLHLLPGLL